MGGGAGGRDIAERLGLEGAARERVEARVEGLLETSGGDPATAVARRGGIDRSIHASLKPATSLALMRNGTGARAPLRRVPEERYTDFQLVGKGGMGVVYLALDTELNRRVAFKMVRPDPDRPRDAPAPATPLQATGPSQEQTESHRSFEELKLRFLQEAWVTGAMEHPGITPVYELGQTGAGIPYYTMRYVKGERTLATAIRVAGDLDARLALLDPFLKVCDALRYAHARGVFHRDLKPENIALGEFGEAVILDWGLSKMAGRPDVSSSLWRSRIEDFRKATDLQSVAGAQGTPGYMAPEAALGKSEDVDVRSDVYSLGAILFEILTGRLPFEFGTFLEYVEKLLQETPPPARDLVDEVPEELAEACARALSRTKEDRFASVDELASAVRRWLQEGPVERQVRELVRNAGNEVEAGGRLGGNAMLWHLDRASAACSKVLHLRPGHGRAREILDEIKRMREGGIRARVATARRKAVFVGGFAVLAVATFVALATVRALSDERADAQRRVEEVRGEVARAKVEEKRAQDAERATRARLADGYAGLSDAYLKNGWVAGARVAAALGLHVQPTARTWSALAAAEARWTPTLRALFRTDAAALRFAGDRLLLAVDSDVRVYDAARGTLGPSLHHEAPVLHMDADGGVAAGAAANGRVRLWDIESGRALADLPKAFAPRNDPGKGIIEGQRPLAVAVVRGGRAVLVSYLDGPVRLWIRDGANAAAVPVSGPEAPVVLLRSAGEYVYGADAHGSLLTWNTTAPWDHEAVGTNVSGFVDVVGAPDGSAAHACTGEQRVCLIEMDSAYQELTVFEGTQERATALALAPDVSRLYAAGTDGTVTVWDLEARARLAALPGHGTVRALAVSDDGKLLAVGSADGVVRVWDLSGGWAREGVAACTAATVAPARDREYVARPDGSVEVWDRTAGGRVARLPASWPPAVALAPVGPGTLFLAASLDGTVRVLDTAQERETARFRLPEGKRPTALLPVPDTDDVFVGLVDGGVERWNWRAGRRVGQLDPESASALPVASLRLELSRLLVRRAGSDVASDGWDLSSQTPIELSEPVPVSPEPAGAAPVAGARSPWVDRYPTSRLIEIEDRCAVVQSGFAAQPVAPERYDLRPRLEPWSR